MDINEVFTSNTLKAADLQGNEIPVVIKSAEKKEFDNGAKIVLAFEGKKKTLVCNKTNASRIAHYYGTNTNGWIGKEIILYPDLVDYQSKSVEAIRVKVRKQQFTPPESGRPIAGTAKRDPMDDEIPFAPEWRA